MKAMKIIMLLAISLFCLACIGQSVPSGKVPTAVLNSFKSKFPEITDVKWAKEPNGNYEGKFETDNNKQRVEFDSKGAWVETETVIATSAVPGNISSAVMKENPGCKISDAEKIQTSDGEIYEVGCSTGKEKKDFRVSPTGKVEKKLENKL